MAADHDIVEQVDKLMRRRRVFVAGGSRPTTRIEPSGDDLPVLTEVVAVTESSPETSGDDWKVEPVVAPDRIEALARELLFERLPVQRQALADELSAWLDHELPPVIMRVIDGLTDQIIAQVTAEARETLLPRLQVAIEAESQSSQDAG